MLNIIVAVAQNNVIGMNGKMPWHLPAELQYFKRITMGHPIIMGRKTFDSIGRVLPGRRNIVVTRNQDWQHDGVDVVHSVAQAISLVGNADAFVIGGATLYEDALNHADQIYLTAIDADVAGDTFFPVINRNTWQEISREHRAADEKNSYAVDFVVLARR
jgi:dihydrofolate reductase